jgi:hypothetical protein
VRSKIDSPPRTGLESILASAFGAGDGAYAWKKEALIKVFETLAAENLAVVGGEIWGIRDFAIYPALPTRQGDARIFSWSAPDKAPGTEWPAYVYECIRYARRAVQDLDAESQVAPSFRHQLVYHLPFYNERDYAAEMRKTIP